MPFPIHINIVDLVFKGMLIGMIASAPMGPVGILCVQRTLNKGRWYGMVTGIGAAISDILYAGITGFGMAFVMDFINNDQNKFYLQIIGSVLLLAFGIFTWRTDPTKNMHRSGQQRGSLWYNMWTAFLVTFSNPLIVFLFMGLFAQFAFVIPEHPRQYCGRRLVVVVRADVAGGQDTLYLPGRRHPYYQSDYRRDSDYFLRYLTVWHSDQSVPFLLNLEYVYSTRVTQD